MAVAASVATAAESKRPLDSPSTPPPPLVTASFSTIAIRELFSSFWKP